LKQGIFSSVFEELMFSINTLSDHAHHSNW